MKSLLLLILTFGFAACQEPQPTESTTPTPEQTQAEHKVMHVADIHAAALVLDAHADIEIPGQESRYAGADGRSQVAPDKMAAGGTDAVVMAIAVGPMPRDEEGFAQARAQADKELAAIQQITSDPSNNTILATSPAELLTAHNSDQQAYILGLQNALILGHDIDAIDEFYESGVRVFAMTHMGHNDYADSSRPLFIAETGTHEPENEHDGLSDLGRAFVSRVNDLGGVMDISQLSKSAALEVMSLSRAPVIASHSNVRAMTDVSRNLSDEELDALKANGGVIHIAPFLAYLFDSNDQELIQAIRAARKDAGVKEDYYYPFELYWEIEDPEAQQAFLSSVRALLGPGRMEDMLNHIDYAVQRIGIDHVGIGTDFNHGSRIEGYQDASDAMNVTAGLVERGYSAEDIAKIWGGNFVRVWQAAQAAAAN